MVLKSFHRPLAAGLVFVASLLLVPAPAFPQLVFEAVGERALGMSGAFVAVADDVTAVHWNPAGLVGGQMVGMTIGWADFQVGDRGAPPFEGASAGRSFISGLATWPFGVSFSSFTRSRLTEDADGALRGDFLSLKNVGVTVLQSLGEVLVVGSTVRVVRGGVVTGAVESPTAGGALDAARDADPAWRTTFDLDVGAVAEVSKFRVGIAVKNLRAPSFRAVAGTAIEVPRQARAGVAVRPSAGVTLAMDLDLNTVALMGDPRRMLAVGGELPLGSRWQVRSGVRRNLAGDRRFAGSAGASVMVRPGVWIDGHYAAGRVDEGREMGIALRAGF